jgi:hypothetical protein
MALFAIGIYVIAIGNFATVLTLLIMAIQHSRLEAGLMMGLGLMVAVPIDAFGVIVMELSRLTNYAKD